MGLIPVESEEAINYEHSQLQPLAGDDQVEIIVFVNPRGVMSGIKTLGFAPLTLEVHKNYHMLEARGKALFRSNAYKAYLIDADVS